MIDMNSRILGGRMFTNGGERVDGEDSTRMNLEPFPKPEKRRPFPLVIYAIARLLSKKSQPSQGA